MIIKMFSNRFKIKSFEKLSIDDFYQGSIPCKNFVEYFNINNPNYFFNIEIIDKIYCLVKYFRGNTEVLTKIYPIEWFNDLAIVEEIKKTVKKLYK